MSDYDEFISNPAICDRCRKRDDKTTDDCLYCIEYSHYEPFDDAEGIEE